MERKLHNFVIFATTGALLTSVVFAISSCGGKTDPYQHLSTGQTFVITSQSDAAFLINHVLDYIENYPYSNIAADEVPMKGLENTGDSGILASRLYWEMAYTFSINYQKKQTIKFTPASEKPWYTGFLGTKNSGTITITPTINDVVTTYVCRYAVLNNCAQFYLGDYSSISQYFLNVAIK